jgi:hypothetical protein
VDNSGLAPSDIGRNADIFPPGQAIENKGGGFLLPVIPFVFNCLEVSAALTGRTTRGTSMGVGTQ